jgi:Zn-dependent protease
MSNRGLIWLTVLVVLVVVLVESRRITSLDIVIFCVIIPSIILHEISHGWVALAFGDDTAKRAGRLTLNPLAHVDVVGTIIVPAFMILSGIGFFGWAKPVPVNVGRLRSPRNEAVLVSLAGPLTNVVLAVIFAVLFHLSGAATSRTLPLWVVQLLFYGGLLNVWLAVFNMIPVPPLDGSALFERLLPRAWWPGYLRIRPYTLPILFGLILLMSLSSANPLVRLEDSTITWWGHVVGLR